MIFRGAYCNIVMHIPLYNKLLNKVYKYNLKSYINVIYIMNVLLQHLKINNYAFIKMRLYCEFQNNPLHFALFDIDNGY